MLDDGAKGQGREEGQRPDQDHDADEQGDEQRRVGRQRPALTGTIFFFASEPAMASGGITIQNRPKSVARPTPML